MKGSCAESIGRPQPQNCCDFPKPGVAAILLRTLDSAHSLRTKGPQKGQVITRACRFRRAYTILPAGLLG